MIALLRTRPAAVLLAVALLSAAPAAPLQAQLVLRVDLDNDAFNFWQPPARRADREYTQGTRVGMLWPSDNRITRRLLGARQQCAAGDAFDCRMFSVALQQLIYTPTLRAVRRVPGERPFAGWLGLETGVRREHARGLAAVSLALGVTGKASLAESAQMAVHGFFGFAKPQGWEAQLPGEVTFTAAYRGARDLLQVRAPGAAPLELLVTPVWEVRAGTLVTDATGGMQVALGIRPPRPWRVTAREAAGHWGLYVVAGATGSVIGRNLFLDGSTFGSSARVPRRRVNGATELGIGVRGPRGLLEWRMHSQGREYDRQPLAHAYSTFAFTLH